MTLVDQAAIPRSPLTPVNLGTSGREVLTEAQIQASGGPAGGYRGQLVQAAPAANASQDLMDALEAGAGVLLRAAAGRLSTGRAATPQRVSARTAASEGGDTGSASADEEPHNAVKRVAAFVELAREMGGGGGGSTGGEAGQQQRQATVARIRESSEARSAQLTNALQEIQKDFRAGRIAAELLTAIITEALHAFSDDAVQQLLALEAVRANTGPYSGAFGDALDQVQDAFTADNHLSGQQMQEVIRDAYVALRLHEAAQLLRSADPAERREGMSHELRNVHRAAVAAKLGSLLDWLKESDPRAGLSAGALRDVFASQMEAAGFELSTNEGAAMDRDHLGSVLTEIAGLKLLNSLYDASEQFIEDSKLPESVSPAAVMSVVLGFVANPAPDPIEGRDDLNRACVALVAAAA